MDSLGQEMKHLTKAQLKQTEEELDEQRRGFQAQADRLSKQIEAIRARIRGMQK